MLRAAFQNRLKSATNQDYFLSWKYGEIQTQLNYFEAYGMN